MLLPLTVLLRSRGSVNATMQDWMANGRTPLEAYDETKKSVAVPGTSEHATGLAVDIIASEYEVWMTGRERRTNKNG